MSITASISVVRDGATPALQALVARLEPERLSPVVGTACMELTQDHLARLNNAARRSSRASGYEHTGFYKQASENTFWEPHAEGCQVRVHKIGMRQRFHGGPIAPVKAGALAIPISPISYGHLPSEFPGLFMIKTPKGAYLCQYGDGDEIRSPKSETRRKSELRKLGGNWKSRKGATLNFLFKLSAGVNQEADPSVLPTHEEYRAAAFAAIRSDLKANPTLN